MKSCLFIIGLMLLSSVSDAQSLLRADARFGVNGKVTFTKPDYFTCLAIQPDLKAVAVGFGDQTTYAFRFKEDGSADSSFGLNGQFTFQHNSTYTEPKSMALNADGSILIGGTYWASKGYVLRLTPNGAPDAAFGNAGYILDSTLPVANSLAIQADGKIIAAGYDLNAAITMRLHPDGRIDSSFGRNGYVRMPFDTVYGEVVKAQVMADGRIVVCGYEPLRTGRTRIFALRYLSDGRPDTSLAHSGKASLVLGSYFMGINTAYVQADNKVLIAGYHFTTGTQALMVRLNEDGSLDTAFAVRGIYSRGGGTILDMTLQPDNKILATGVVGSGGFLRIRLLPDGQLDATFGYGGFLYDFEGHGRAIAYTPDRKFVYAGDVHQGNIISLGAVLRFREDSAMAVRQVFSEPDGILVYPNPANGKVTLRSIDGVPISGAGLVSASGQRVLETTTAGSEVQLALKGIAPGTYFLKCRLQGGRIIHRRLVLSGENR